MSRRLDIELEHSEGALLRVLGTVERRGFSLLAINAGKPDADCYALQLLLDGQRDPQVLCRQLERLVEVRAARLLPETSATDEPTASEGFQASWLQ